MLTRAIHTLQVLVWAQPIELVISIAFLCVVGVIAGTGTSVLVARRRHKIALQNFEEAGLSEYIDARLADAHKLVEELEGPFDFVFSDADKGWYKNYFIAVAPKLKIGGCFTAHNISMRGTGIREFVDYIENIQNFDTTIDNSSRSGLSISYKKSDIISASDIGQFQYCSVSWYLKKCGYKSESPKLKIGSKKHSKIGEMIDYTHIKKKDRNFLLSPGTYHYYLLF